VGWNFGDILDAISPVIPADAPAFIHGERTISWGESTRATNNMARGLIARGAQPGDKIAIYMRNRPEYLMALAAGFKLDGESSIFANKADDHTKTVFDPSIRFHTDQFLLRFKKPN